MEHTPVFNKLNSTHPALLSCPGTHWAESCCCSRQDTGWTSAKVVIGRMFPNKQTLLPHCHSTWGGGWWWVPCRRPPSWGSGFSRSANWRASGLTHSVRWCSAASLQTTACTLEGDWFFLPATVNLLDIKWWLFSRCDDGNEKLIPFSSYFIYLQSRCFFFGPIISSVVALHTALARPWKWFFHIPNSEHFKATPPVLENVRIFLSMSQMFTCPARLCLAARILSLIVWPAADILNQPSDSETQQPWRRDSRHTSENSAVCFPKRGGPPIIMGPPGLRTAVRAVAGCQYPHSPALHMRTATSFKEEHAQIVLKDRAPAHLMHLTS